MSSSHGLENIVRPALERDMKVLARRRRVCHGIDDTQTHVPGMTRNEAQTVQAGYRADGSKEVGKFALGDHVASIGALFPGVIECRKQTEMCVR